MHNQIHSPKGEASVLHTSTSPQLPLPPSTPSGPLGEGRSGVALSAGHGVAGSGVLDGTIASVQHDDHRDASHTEVGSEGILAASVAVRQRGPGHGCVVVVEGAVVAVTRHEHDFQSVLILSFQGVVDSARTGVKPLQGGHCDATIVT